NRHAQSTPPLRAAGLRLSRRALLGAGALALLAACRGGTGPTASSTPTGSRSPSPAGSPAPPAASPPPTQSTAVPGTPAARGPRVFYQWGFATGPVSHDFNANRACGGEPELWAGLLTLNPDCEPVPDWAEAWSARPDGQAWTFHL